MNLREQAEKELSGYFKMGAAQRTENARQDARIAQRHISSAINAETSARADSAIDRQWLAYQFGQVRDLLADPTRREEYLRLSTPDHPYLKVIAKETK